MAIEWRPPTKPKQAPPEKPVFDDDNLPPPNPVAFDVDNDRIPEFFRRQDHDNQDHDSKARVAADADPEDLTEAKTEIISPGKRGQWPREQLQALVNNSSNPPASDSDHAQIFRRPPKNDAAPRTNASRDHETGETGAIAVVEQAEKASRENTLALTTLLDTIRFCIKHNKAHTLMDKVNYATTLRKNYDQGNFNITIEGSQVLEIISGIEELIRLKPDRNQYEQIQMILESLRPIVEESRRDPLVRSAAAERDVAQTEFATVKQIAERSEEANRELIKAIAVLTEHVRADNWTIASLQAITEQAPVIVANRNHVNELMIQDLAPVLVMLRKLVIAPNYQGEEYYTLRRGAADIIRIADEITVASGKAGTQISDRGGSRNTPGKQWWQFWK